MKFKTVAECFQDIEAKSSRLAITQKLAELLKQVDPQEAAIICNLSLGELRPPYMNAQFNIAQKSVVPIVASLLDKPLTEITQDIRIRGDVGLVVAHGLWESHDEISVSYLYDQLSSLQAIGGIGSVEQKAAHLLALLKQVDPLSAKFIVRIVLGKLRLGFSDMTLIDALSWMECGDKSLRKIIEHAYNKCADIGLIAKTLKADGVEALETMQIKIGIPIRPAAAERLPNVQAIFDKLGPCVAQPKLDGFRLQIHLDKTQEKPLVRFFSRNLKDMSEMFPDLVHALLQLNVDTLICEGEAIGYDAKTDTFLPFQETVKRKRKHGVEQAASDFPLKLFLFDLLFLNSKPLLPQTHEQRYTVLQQIAPSNTNQTVQTIQEKIITNPEQLEDYFLHCLNEGLEGIVVKRPDAIYQPGKRNFNWIKLKRHSESKVEDTIDCVILGYYYGAGKRVHFGIGAFLVGVYNKQTDQLETVAKVGTGLTDQEWRDLKQKCDAIQVVQKPKNVWCAKELFPDVWVNPEIVCMIQADEITRSPLHTACKTQNHSGLALRFPRLLGYRDDKNALDSTTAVELEDMYEHQTSR